MLFSIIVSTLLLCSTSLGLQRDYLWTVSLTVSDAPGSEYEGVLEIVVVFKDQNRHSTILPSTRYDSGRKFDFPMRFTSDGPVDAVYLRTRGFCPLGLLPTDVLRLQRLDLVSKSGNIQYSKRLDDLAVKDACQSTTSQGSSFTDFQESTVSSCVGADGRKYENGQRFEIECSASCSCENGSIFCVDMCTAVAWAPDQKCHFVHSPGQCCPGVLCENDPKTKSCQEFLQPADGKTKDQRTAVPVKRYPWAVLYCADINCTQMHAGIIIGSKHILTYATDLSYLTQLRVSMGEYIVDQDNASDFTSLRIVNVTAHSDFVNQNSPIADSASRLQLVEFEQSFSLGKQISSTNVPFDRDHCAQLSKNECPSMTVGWDRTDDADDSVRQWFLHADRSRKDESLCVTNKTNRANPKILPRRRGDKRVCVGGLVRPDCSGPLGGALITNAAETDFVVGLTDPDSALFVCDNPGTASVLPLCKYVDWINEVTKANLQEFK